MGWRAEQDGWSVNGAKINSPENLAIIEAVMEGTGPIIVQHFFYRGARSPELRGFDDFDDFRNWLDHETAAGDIIEVWNFSAVCNPDNVLVSGKYPDERGEVPAHGPY